MNAPESRPLLVWDGDCGFCRRWIDRWREESVGRVDFEPYQSAAARHPEVPVDEFRRAIHLFHPDGRITRGAEAAFEAVSATTRGKLALTAYRRIPGVAPVCEAIYRFIAAHRGAADRMTTLLWGHDVRRPRYDISSRLFLAGLGLTFLIAFVSFLVQLTGLIGADGILPAAQFLDAARAQVGNFRFDLVPTLFWFDASNRALIGAGFAGIALSLLLMTARGARLAVPLLWLLYLSWCGVAGEFLSFQWDTLLLETAVVGIFVAFRAKPGPALVRWLLVRFMFSSGVAKLASGDPTWRHLTALDYHYETQCLPTWIGWFAHQLPHAVQAASVVIMFGIELVLPFFVFLPRNFRLLAAAGFLSLQLLIALTGNYGYFNVLTVVLCLMLIDDALWRRWIPPLARRFERRPTTPTGGDPPPRRDPRLRGVGLTLAFLYVALSLVPLSDSFRRPPLPLIWPLVAINESLQPFRSINGYGLFAVMTTRRMEIEIEGSDDDSTWTPYIFHWKPGDPARRPEFVAPYMPRLDWQMWFAALGPPSRSRWMGPFFVRLLKGSRPVRALLAPGPFADHPPKLLRAMAWQYEMTSATERKATGEWWKRSPGGEWVPPVELGADGQSLRRFRAPATAPADSSGTKNP